MKKKIKKKVFKKTKKLKSLKNDNKYYYINDAKSKPSVQRPESIDVIKNDSDNGLQKVNNNCQLPQSNKENIIPEKLKGKQCTFTSMKDIICEKTLRAVKEMGFVTMTDIQARTIPKLMKGFDLRGTAKTGSGKTLAFLIPVVELLVKQNFKPSSGTGSIIVSPTRELSIQIFKVLEDLLKYHSLTIGLLIGGNSRKTEVMQLSKGINIIVSTPGRLLDHLKNTSRFAYEKLKCLVLDEADRILDDGFEKDLLQIIELLPKKRQNVLFSATKSDRVNKISKLILKSNIVEVDVDRNKVQATAEGLTQTYIVCPMEKKALVLFNFLSRCLKKKVMVFFNSCLAVTFYSQILNKIGIESKSIHGRQDQQKRTETFNEFTAASAGILICTDVAARGLDFPFVDWIIQFDPPDDPKNYIHRVGRTARSGGKGEALLFLCENEIGYIDYLKQNKVSMEEMEIEWSKIANLQSKLEKIVADNVPLSKNAKGAFLSFVRAYQSHSSKDIFNVYKLDLNKVAKNFMLPKHPDVILYKKFPNNQQRGKNNFGSRSKMNDKRFPNDRERTKNNFGSRSKKNDKRFPNDRERTKNNFGSQRKKNFEFKNNKSKFKREL